VKTTTFTAADLYAARPLANPAGAGPVPLVVFPAQVLEVCLDTSSPMYREPTDIGSIKFKAMGPGSNSTNRFESLTTTVASLLNRNCVRYPIPGEQVMVYIAAGDFQSNYVEELVQYKAYYDQIVSTNLNPTYNSSPFIATSVDRIEEGGQTSLAAAERRFDDRVNDLEAYREGGKVKIFKQLKPFEGDFILQGRFGNTIRFGSTSGATENPWSKSGSPGLSGDPIMLLRVDREYTTSTSDMFIQEDINKDDCSIMLCSSQKVEMELSCGQLKSWITTPGAERKKWFNRSETAAANSSTGTAQATAAIGSADKDATTKAIDAERSEVVANTENQQSAETEQTPPVSTDDGSQ
jgi:hypothetical protein